MLKHGTDYVLKGMAEFEAKFRARTIKALERKAKTLGYQRQPHDTLTRRTARPLRQSAANANQATPSQPETVGERGQAIPKDFAILQCSSEAPRVPWEYSGRVTRVTPPGELRAGRVGWEDRTQLVAGALASGSSSHESVRLRPPSEVRRGAMCTHTG